MNLLIKVSSVKCMALCRNDEIIKIEFCGGRYKMQKGLNFRTIESQKEYFDTYEKSIKLISVPFTERYVATTFGDSHVICCGNEKNPPLVLIHAASCGSPIWYKNIPFWSRYYCVYAIDLIGESSKSILIKKMKTPHDNANWLDETMIGLKLNRVFLCGLSIGGWNAANYACFYPEKVLKLVLLSPVQTFAKMHPSYFLKIMKMGFNPTRQNVENYIGWGSKKEESLPDSIIKQFTLSVMNMNSNASFPKWIRKKYLISLKMPVFVMFGENEFAFSIRKAEKRARSVLSNLELEIVKEASHLLPVSRPEYINKQVLNFIENQAINH